MTRFGTRHQQQQQQEKEEEERGGAVAATYGCYGNGIDTKVEGRLH